MHEMHEIYRYTSMQKFVRMALAQKSRIYNGLKKLSYVMVLHRFQMQDLSYKHIHVCVYFGWKSSFRLNYALEVSMSFYVNEQNYAFSDLLQTSPRKILSMDSHHLSQSLEEHECTMRCECGTGSNLEFLDALELERGLPSSRETQNLLRAM